jgi:Terminase large subunit, T4likevirus-type, N-terminal
MPATILRRIERLHDAWLKTQQDEESRKKPLVTGDILEFCRKILGWTPFPYQEKLLRDPARFIVARMSRQSGKSTTLAVLALYTALSTADARVMIVAPSLRQARMLIHKIWRVARKVRRVFRNRPLKGRLEFRNGSVVEALPNSPETIRGQTSNLVIIDEFNFIKDDKALYDSVVFTLMTTNGRAIVASTPGSEDSIFYHMCTDKDGAYANVSRHHTSYRDATEPNGPIKSEVLEQVRGQYTGEESRWIREMEAEFANDDDRWIPMSLIMKCVDPNLKPIPDEEIYEEALKTEEGREVLDQLGVKWKLSGSNPGHYELVL